MTSFASESRLEVNPTSYSLTVQNGASPLYVASQEGHSDVVDILLEAGADVHRTTTEVRSLEANQNSILDTIKGKDVFVLR